jgi:adenosine kinase
MSSDDAHIEKKQKTEMAESKNTGVFLGMGNPLLDICATVGDDMFEKYGVTLNNAILAEEKHLPMYEDLVSNFDVQYIAGGATQNTVRVTQWMMQQPGATSYIGCIGNDNFGEQLRKSATADGVNVCYQVDSEAATGTCGVLIKDKERSLIANLAAANNYKIDHLESEEITAVWEAAKFYYIAGFFLTVSPPSIMKVANHAKDNNKVFCMNLSAPFITQFFTDPLMAALPFCDFVFGNESEAEAFGQKFELSDTSVEAVALHIANLPKENKERPRVVIITQGDKATCVATDGKTTNYDVPPVAADDIVDVNGAGDAFVGGFMSELIKGSDIAKCVEAGHYAASVIIKTSGTVLIGEPSFN